MNCKCESEYVTNELHHLKTHSFMHFSSPYDWGAGVYVYIFSLSLMFISTIVMEVRKKDGSFLRFPTCASSIPFVPGCQHKSK